MTRKSTKQKPSQNAVPIPLEEEGQHEILPAEAAHPLVMVSLRTFIVALFANQKSLFTSWMHLSTARMWSRHPSGLQYSATSLRETLTTPLSVSSSLSKHCCLDI